jgi:sucrose-6-phosphate hydrolase SacC (GH32 family)
LTAQLKDHILVAQKGLQKLSEKGVEEVKMTLRFWFNGGHAPQMGDTTSKVRRVARDWAESWSLAQPSTEDHEFKQNLSIPDRLSIEDLGRTHAAVSFEDANYYEAIRKGREPSMSDADINNAVKDLKSA